MRFFGLFLFAFLTSGALHAQSKVTIALPPDFKPADLQNAVQQAAASTIVPKAVANDELRRQHRLALECDQTITTDRLDEAGKSFKTKQVRVVHREGHAFAYSADVDATSESTAKDGDTAKAEHLQAVMNLRKLAPRFRYAISGTGEVRGRPCWIVSYSPKGDQAAATREDKVINNLHGRYWIDQATSEILQGEGSLASPVSTALVASVTRMDFRFHSQTLPNGEAGPAEFSVDLAVQAPFYFYRQRQTSRMENWRGR